jgi:hypothetical protein
MAIMACGTVNRGCCRQTLSREHFYADRLRLDSSQLANRQNGLNGLNRPTD